MEVLTYVITLSLETGIFMDKLKLAVVVPLFKKNLRCLMQNYSPVPLFSSFAKITEKIMKQQLLCFLNYVIYFSSKHYGFRKDKRSEDAMEFESKILDEMNNGDKISGLF